MYNIVHAYYKSMNCMCEYENSTLKNGSWHYFSSFELLAFIFVPSDFLHFSIGRLCTIQITFVDNNIILYIRKLS